MKKLNCEECTKTNNHCCKADIPYSPLEAMSMILYGEKVGIKNITLMPSNKIKKDYFVIIDNSWIKSDDSVDLSDKNCVFFIEGKCSIYENRPNICRLYGTEMIRCRYEASNIDADKIAKATRDDILFLDSEAFNKSKINTEQNRILNLLKYKG
jgi:Fe-S-cluster containining protein